MIGNLLIAIFFFNDVIMTYKESKSHILGSVVQVQQDEENNIKKLIIIDG